MLKYKFKVLPNLISIMNFIATLQSHFDKLPNINVITKLWKGLSWIKKTLYYFLKKQKHQRKNKNKSIQKHNEE